ALRSATPPRTSCARRPGEYAAAWMEPRHCASCHVRRWQRLGPPHLAPSLLPLPGYPRLEAAVYERADFCLPCHQLPARQAVAGRPLLDTYREWLQGPYMPRGVQCQHCHMPNREHSFRGIHDPDTVRQGVAVKLTASRSGTGVVTVRGVATNVGAGHYLPTTPTPALWLTLELLDDAGRPIKGAHSRTRIGRQLVFSGGAWRQEADTRIAPGAELSVVRAWRDGRVASARRARLALEVFPDDYYEGFYRTQLAAEKQPQARAHYQEALRRAIASRYLAVEQFVELSP
ncbi:MAG TPA: hypothetical protein PKU97_08300, partial [Kofleriaceae bacterium]|nr:hypothetical protein [Kofleriaceae bacterium]